MEKSYKVGDTVRLVSGRPYRWNFDGKMDHFLGSVQEITHIDSSTSIVKFKDFQTWSWLFYLQDIECKVDPESEFMQGEKVLVWDDTNITQEATFITKIYHKNTDYPYLVVTRINNELSYWKFCKKAPQTQTFTKAEIAERLGLKEDEFKIKC